mgnify:CR=1 FL=1
MRRGASGVVEFDAHEAEVALVAHLGSFLEISNPDAHGRVDMVASGAMVKALRTAAARALAAAVKEKLPDTGTTGGWKMMWGPSLVDEVMAHREEPEMRYYRARQVAKDIIRRDCALAEKKRSHKRKKR